MDKQCKAIDDMLSLSHKKLMDIMDKYDGENDAQLALDRLERWRERTAADISKLISPSEGKKLINKRPSVTYTNVPKKNIEAIWNLYSSHVIVLQEELKDHHEFVFSKSRKTKDKPSAGKTEGSTKGKFTGSNNGRLGKEEIVKLSPEFFGMGFDLKALWRKFRRTRRK